MHRTRALPQKLIFANFSRRMMWLLVTSLILATGAGADVVLTQSGDAVKKPGESHRMSCQGSGFPFSNYHMNWVRQAPEKGLEWVAYIYADSSGKFYSAAVQNRFTVSRDNPGSVLYLDMGSLRAEDSAKYYCTNYWSFDVWGPGTTVAVTEVASQAPSLYPLISCGASQDPVAIGCLAKDFLPDPVTFSWSDKNNSSFTDGFHKYPSVLGSSGMYTASSGVQVPLNNWNNRDPYYCKVTHSALGQPLVKKLVLQVNKAIQPIVTLHPPIKEDIDNRNATIVCMCRGFYPQAISVTWLKNGVKVTSGVHTEVPVSNGAGDFDLTSSLDITAPDWNRNYLYSCLVEHAASNYWNAKNISKSLLCEATSSGPATVDVFTVAPTFEEVFVGKSAKLTCVVTNMQNHNSLNITWTNLSKKEVLKPVITDVVLNDNGTYSATGIATVCAEDWTARNQFECKVLHDELASQKSATLQKKNGTPASKPVVYVYPPSSEELALKEYVTIIALIKRYNPCDVLVKWMKEKDEIPKADYVNTKPIEIVDPTTEHRTCLLYSTLRVTESEWNSGTVFTCVVGHETLPMQLTQKSIDKSSGKPTSINVSLVMSDAASTCY